MSRVSLRQRGSVVDPVGICRRLDAPAAFGAPSAALALMRSTMEIVLRDHYGAQGDDLKLFERINNSRNLLPSSANAEALHRLRMIANAVLHLDIERNEALPKLKPVELEKKNLRLLRVVLSENSIRLGVAS